MLADYQAVGDWEHHRRLHQATSNETADYFQSLHYQANGRGLRQGFVPNTMLWLMADDNLVGEANVRHYLTPSLLREGGHVGYRITPSWRRQGYGTEILRLALLELSSWGIPYTLLTCDTINTGSARIIQKNGGRFENELKSFHSGHMVSRYWFVTSTTPGEPFPHFEESGPAGTQEKVDVVAFVSLGERLLVLEDVHGMVRLPAGPRLNHETAANAAWRLLYQQAGLANLRQLTWPGPTLCHTQDQHRLLHLRLGSTQYLTRTHGHGRHRYKLRWYRPVEMPVLPRLQQQWWQQYAELLTERAQAT